MRTATERILDIQTIYHEPDVPQSARGAAVLARFPDAERIVVPSHQAIPELYGNAGAVDDWIRNKRSVLVLGTKKALAARPNGRSSDFIAPSTSNGCAMACSYEVHLNFSPVVVHEGWLEEWRELLRQVADGVGEAARRQLACEVIFLTHNKQLHEVNLGWHPQGEEELWRPDLQQAKRSQNGQWNVRYKTTWKSRWVRQLTELIDQELPDCRVRYAF